MPDRNDTLSSTRRQRLQQKLLAYSAAASVAIAGGAGLPDDVQAQFSYTDVDPDVDLTLPATGTGTVFDIDFDGDGDPEFAIAPVALAGGTQTGFLFRFDTAGSDIALGVIGSSGSFFNYPYALSSGDPISSGQNLQVDDVNGFALATSFQGAPYGNFFGVTDGFIGVQFQLEDGNTYFGWVRVDVDAAGDNLTVKDLAYRTDGAGIAAAALPVELTAFDVSTVGQDMLLRWQTSSETNNAGFEVQVRNALDGAAATFEEAAFVEGAGTTTEAQTYSHRIPGLAPGRYEVRLKQLDFDGAFEYSPVREVEVALAGTHALAAYPNPLAAGQSGTLAVQVGEDQPVRVEVFNTLGQRVAMLHDGEVAATRGLEVEFGAGLASGTYLVRVTGQTFQDSRRITVVR